MVDIQHAIIYYVFCYLFPRSSMFLRNDRNVCKALSGGFEAIHLRSWAQDSNSEER
jgi:hypothetical protein